MAIAELQFREEAFCGLLRDLVNARRLPAATVPGTTLVLADIAGHPLDSIKAVGCTLESGPTEGAITARLDLLIRYYDSFADARTAGSLKQPATLEAHQPLPLTLQVNIDTSGPNPTARLAWSVPFNLFAGESIDLGLDSIPAASAAIVVDAGVVAIRVGTTAGDQVLAPIVDRLAAGADWTTIVPGELIAQPLIDALNDAGAAIADAEHEVGVATGSYVTDDLTGFGFPPPPFGLASVVVVAIDACPLFDIDVPVKISLFATFVATGVLIETTLRLSWAADSFWCEIAGGLLLTPIASAVIASEAEGAARSAVLGSAPPEAFAEIARDDDSITFRGTRLLDLPRQLLLTSSAFTAQGLVLAGTIAPAPMGQGLQGWVDPPSSDLVADCTARRVTVQFDPATVGLLDYGGGGGPPRLFNDWTVFDPPGAWTAMPSQGGSWQELLVTFFDPPTGRLPAGTATSVFLMTDCGLRWVDLGVIPEEHAPPTNADTAGMISSCMALSAGWREQVLSVFWLPRPPEERFGLPALRHWQIALREVPPSARLEFVAIDAEGLERSIGVVEGQSSYGLQLTTNADETLEVRCDTADYGAIPSVAQRWIVPAASTPLQDAPARMGDVVARGRRSGRHAWNTAAGLSSGGIAVEHDGALFVGRAGRLQRL